MRTNIPHGIAQRHRAHPLFIILRKHAETEERLFRSLVRHTIVTAALSLVIMFGVAIMAILVEFCSAILVALVGSLILFIISEIQMIRIIWALTRREGLIFPKVNRMIFSDDFASSSLNYEALVNLSGEANRSISFLENKISDVDSSLITILIILATAVFMHYLTGGFI